MTIVVNVITAYLLICAVILALVYGLEVLKSPFWLARIGYTVEIWFYITMILVACKLWAAG
jgi:hypothetical protein